MAELAALIDRAVALPPGPELSAALAALPWEKLPNARVVEVLQARSRQLSHEQAEFYAGMVEISHTVALDKLPEDLPGKRAEAVLRAEGEFEWASHEIAAGLTLTPGKADRELAFGLALCERLPLVHAALLQGRIDLGKARVFVDYLDPAGGEITEAQAWRLCERFLPVAPGLTTRQLADRLYRALLAIDPALRRRRYERAVQGRGVALYLDPRTGTATLVGNGLPADEAAAAAERNDRLVDAAKRAGHPGTRGQIGADIYLGMLNGAFYGLTEEEIIGWVLGHQRPEDNPNADTTCDADADADTDADAADTDSGDSGDSANSGDTNTDTADTDTADTDTGGTDTGGTDTGGTGTGTDGEDAGASDGEAEDAQAADGQTEDTDAEDTDTDAEDEGADDSSGEAAHGEAESAGGSAGETAHGEAVDRPTDDRRTDDRQAGDRWAGERVGIR